MDFLLPLYHLYKIFPKCRYYYLLLKYNDYNFHLIDTGGIDISKEVFKENKTEQSQQTVDEVSVCNNTKPEKPENLFENNNVRPQNPSAVPAYTAVIKENPPIKPIVHSRIEEPVKNEEKVENFSYINRASLQKTEPVPEKTVKPAEEKKELRYIGEAFKGYIISEIDDKIVIVDKHAAHERIIYESLKK